MIRQEAFEAAAFAPGHVTGFFSIEDEAEDPAAIGSRGAGFSVEAGVTSEARMRRGGFPGVDLRIDGRPAEAETSRESVQLLLGREPWDVRIDQRMDLPVGQGFGMSAAGALSAALAVAEILGRPPEDALWAAHTAEVIHRTGLGDAVGAFAGGFEVRVRAGIPPSGEVRVFDRTPRSVLLAVVDDVLPTRRVLSDPERREAARRVGRRAVDAFLAAGPDVPGFVRASRGFAQDARFASARVRDALASLGGADNAAQCMLGGSVFVLDPSQAQADALSSASERVRSVVARQGARVTRPVREWTDAP